MRIEILLHKLLTRSQRYTAFTLAEVLITLAVIGVPAAITIPAMINDIKDAQYISSLKKVYADLSSATAKMKIDNNDIWPDFTDDSMRDEYKKYLAVTKTGPASEIFTYTLKHKYSDDTIDFTSGESSWGAWLNSTLPSIQLNNGALLIFNSGFNCTSFNPGSYGRIGYEPNICGYIWVDVNGLKGPNTMARDVFAFQVRDFNNDRDIIKLVPAGTDGDALDCDKGYDYDFDQWGCTAKVLMSN